MTAYYQILGDLSIYYERIAVSLGFATLAAGLATFGSCRTFVTFVSRHSGANLLSNKAYQSFYKYHGYYWWSFLIILIVHMASATIHTQLLPKAGDPDAFAHWMILGFALASIVAVTIQFLSCRTFAGLVNFFTGKTPVKSRVYKAFYEFHAYYWWIFLVAVGGHFIAAAIHTNFWPR
jgi:cytochrome b561